MNSKDAIMIMDENIPHPSNRMVDIEHLPIANAWLKIKEDLKAFDNFARSICDSRVRVGAVVPTCENLLQYIEEQKKQTAKCILDEVSKHFGGRWLSDLYEKYGLVEE